MILTPALADRAQTRLHAAGYDPHGVDGQVGRYTLAALFGYVADADLGEVGLALADGALASWSDAGITTPLRIAHLVGQAAAETGFRTFVENLSYSAAGLLATWPGRCTPALAAQDARNPRAIANRVYADRMGNGSRTSGDGWIYRGRGPTMLTGLANYRSVGAAMKLGLEEHPDMAAEPAIGMRIMARFWEVRGCNARADDDDVAGVTWLINGGRTGWRRGRR